MSITVGHTTFDRADFDESPEGHARRYDRDGRLVGITIVNAKQLLDRAKPIVITIPEQVTIDPATLAPAVESAA